MSWLLQLREGWPHTCTLDNQEDGGEKGHLPGCEPQPCVLVWLGTNLFASNCLDCPLEKI